MLWATHLIEEAGEDAQVVVLHRGRVLAHGAVPAVVAAAGAAGLQDAFERLTRVAA